MTFLAPIAGLAVAGLGGGAVLLLYFLKLRRRPVRVSAVRFWTEAAHDLQVNAPFRWLRPSWLLLLHLLAVACLAIAAARPVLDLVGEPGGRAIIVVDRSASMSAVDAPGEGTVMRSRLSLAKARALELVERSPATEIMVVEFAAQARTLTNFSRDRSLVRRAVEEIQPSDQTGDLGGAIRLAAAAALSQSTPGPESGGGKQARIRVAIFSDGGSPFDADSPPPGLPSLNIDLVRCGPVRVGMGENVGIVAMSARRDIDRPSLARVFVRVQSTLEKPVTVPITCTLNARPVGAVSLEVPGAARTPGSPASAQDSSHTFEVDAPEGGVVRVEIPRPDALASDNAAAIELLPVRTIRAVLVLAGRSPANDAEASLQDGLSTLDRVAARTISLSDYDSGAATNTLNADLFIFAGVTPKRWTPTAGASAITFGTGLPIAGIRALDSQEQGGQLGFTDWSRTQPIMRYVALGDVLFSKCLVYSWPQGTAAPSVQTLASSVSGPAIVLTESAGGRSRALLVGVDLASSNWYRDLSFPVFLANAVDALTSRGDQNAGRSWSTTVPVEVSVGAVIGQGGTTGDGESGSKERGLTMIDPQGVARQVPVTAERVCEPGVLERVGVYLLRLDSVGGAQPGSDAALGQPAPDTRPICVNLLDPRESEIRSTDRLDVGGGDVAAKRLEDLAPREVWHWFVFASMVILSVEWIVFAVKSRV